MRMQCRHKMDPLKQELQQYTQIRDQLLEEQQVLEEEFGDFIHRLRSFEARFLQEVAPLQQKLSRWEQRCALHAGVIQKIEEHFLSHPNATISMGSCIAEVEKSLEEPPPSKAPKAMPVLSAEEHQEAKTIYRGLARRFHPDRVQDDEIRQKRKEVMIEINRAYQERDLPMLRSLLHAPDIRDPQQETMGESWERMVREIAQLRQSIANTHIAYDEAKKTELVSLMESEEDHPFQAYKEVLESKIHIQKSRWRQLRIREEELWMELDG